MKWLPWIVFAVFGFYLVGNNFNAKLGLIDDHEIAMFLGSDGKVSVDEFPKEILKTEIGQWGSYLRYRPSYYTLRVLETALWRDDARLWYLSRYLMLVVSMVLGYQIMIMYFPQIVSYLFIFYIMTMPFWPDMLTRLGPSEMYALPAVLMFAYGMIKNKLWMITVGYLICVGSKENFLILLPILLGWAGFKAYIKKLSNKELIATIVLILYTLLIVGSIVVATASAGTDIYGSSISYRYRITKFVWDIPKIISNRHLLPAILVLIAGIVISFKKMKLKIIIKQAMAMVTILLVIATQYIFYINQLPSNMRYDFPALLLFPILDLLALSMIITYFKKSKYIGYIRVSIYALMILIFATYIFRRSYTLVQAQSIKNAAQTRTFNDSLNRAQIKVLENPETGIIFVSERYIDFEPIASVERFLTSRGAKNEFRLYYNPPTTTQDPMELDVRLKDVMNGNVGTDHIFDRFTAFREDQKPCYTITFGNATPLESCPEIARF